MGASFVVSVYLKTHTGGATEAAQRVAVGKLKVVYPSASCAVTGDGSRNGDFATWDPISGLGAGAYGLFFSDGYVEGDAVLMVVVSMECDAGTHEIGVETMEHADSDGVSAAPSLPFLRAPSFGSSLLRGTRLSSRMMMGRSFQ